MLKLSDNRITVYFNTHVIRYFNSLSEKSEQYNLSVYQLLQTTLKQPKPYLSPEKVFSESAILWLDIVDPTENELLELAQLTSLNQINVDDLFEVNRYTDKYNYFSEYLFLELQNNPHSTCTEKEFFFDKYETTTFYILNPSLLVTIRGKANTVYRDELINIIEESPFSSKTSLSPEYLLFLLINSNLQDLYKAVNSAEIELDSIENMLSEISKEDQLIFFKNVFVIGAKIKTLIRNLRLKPTLIKKLLHDFKTRLTFNLSANSNLLQKKSLDTHQEALQIPLIINYYLDIKNSIYGLRALHDDAHSLLTRCNRFNHVLSDSYNYYLSTLLLESDQRRLAAFSILQNFSQIFGLSALSSILLQLFGTNVNIPFGVNQSNGEKNFKYNIQYLPFIFILVISLAIPISIYFKLGSSKKPNDQSDKIN
ncbi:hypothetical protein BB561_002866 [Smittium simulii]|uniref:Magnesium transporter n=1 Tax=Smittium simulii TaxID=133385 RepID=A0A2T9YNV1_9FUNG|nr:hypothetical protein BB561_002866 [Smittium simulii]